MTDDRAPVPCPPHRWEITLLYLAEGLHDHYRCMSCAAEKDIPRAPVSAWGHRPAGRPKRST